MHRFAAILAVALLSAPLVRAESGTWKVDPNHSTIEFSVRHMMISNVKGRFETFSGFVTGDPSHPEGARVSVKIDPASITTGVDNRDDDLRSADFLDVQKYPEMTFVSKRVVRGPGGYQVVGNLTMHGVTREVPLKIVQISPVIRDARGNSRVAVTASTRINRRDFGVTWSKTLDGGGVVAGDEVGIDLSMELVREGAK